MKKVFVLLITMSLILSCQKEDDSLTSDPDTKTLSHNYMPLEIGNYWVYENYSVELGGSERASYHLDSVIVTRDTIIGIKHYFILEGTWWPHIRDREIVNILRDSAGTILNHEGRIKMSEYIFNDTLDAYYGVFDNDTAYCLYTMMVEGHESIVVPAGTFEVLKRQGDLYSYMFDPPRKHTLNTNECYSQGVGLVLKKMIYVKSDDYYIEKRLLRYHVNE